MSKETKKVVYHPDFQTSGKQPAYSGKIEEKNILDNGEDDTMGKETYSKSEIDLKLANIETKIDNRFEQLNQKIDYSVQHILSETKNMLLEQQIKEKTEREAERKSTNRW